MASIANRSSTHSRPRRPIASNCGSSSSFTIAACIAAGLLSAIVAPATMASRGSRPCKRGSTMAANMAPTPLTAMKRPYPSAVVCRYRAAKRGKRAPRATLGVTNRAVRTATARSPGVFLKYRQPEETAPSRLSAAEAPRVDRRRSSLPRHTKRNATWGKMTTAQSAKNTVVPAPLSTAPPSTGPMSWPMFH